MAKIEERNVSLIDDFDGTKASETVRFSLDGKNFEIDLSKSNANELNRPGFPGDSVVWFLMPQRAEI